MLPVNFELLNLYGLNPKKHETSASSVEQSVLPAPACPYAPISQQSSAPMFRCNGLHRTTKRICGRLFKSQEELNDHIDKNHDSFADIETGEIRLDKSAHPIRCFLGFKCSSCGAVYTDRPNCMKHILPAHWGKRRMCPFCPKGYTQISTLKKHIKRYHKEPASSK
jgi:uncharacterized C2H2 Zn-finger protein